MPFGQLLATSGRRRSMPLPYPAPLWRQRSVPCCVFPGRATIERHIPLPLRQYRQHYRQVRDIFTLYRLAVGQSRQEDLIELLRPRVSQKTTADGTRVLVNLAPNPGRVTTTL
jgi:hypothetical protein